jgi:hypothetical protein
MPVKRVNVVLDSLSYRSRPDALLNTMKFIKVCSFFFISLHLSSQSSKTVHTQEKMPYIGDKLPKNDSLRNVSMVAESGRVHAVLAPEPSERRCLVSSHYSTPQLPPHFGAEMNHSCTMITEFCLTRHLSLARLPLGRYYRAEA